MRCVDDYARRGALWWLVNNFLGGRRERMADDTSPASVRRRLVFVLFDDDVSWSSALAQIRDMLRNTGWERDEHLAAMLHTESFGAITVERVLANVPCPDGVVVRREADGHDIGRLDVDVPMEIHRSSTFVVQRPDGRLTLSHQCGGVVGVEPMLNGRTHAESEAEIARLREPVYTVRPAPRASHPWWPRRILAALGLD